MTKQDEIKVSEKKLLSLRQMRHNFVAGLPEIFFCTFCIGIGTGIEKLYLISIILWICTAVLSNAKVSFKKIAFYFFAFFIVLGFLWKSYSNSMLTISTILISFSYLIFLTYTSIANKRKKAQEKTLLDHQDDQN